MPLVWLYKIKVAQIKGKWKHFFKENIRFPFSVLSSHSKSVWTSEKEYNLSHLYPGSLPISKEKNTDLMKLRFKKGIL